MTDTVKVLTWGSAEEGACHYFRGGMFQKALLDHGVEMRDISKLSLKAFGEYAHEHGPDQPEGVPCDRCNEAAANGRMGLDMSVIKWADVVFFRRYYNTSYACAATDGEGPMDGSGCGFLTRDPIEAEGHPHGVRSQDSITRQMWPLFRDHWTGGIVYDTDDLHVSTGVQKWNGYWKATKLENDLIADMAKRADILTVATPALARKYGVYNSNVRVIRNAVDPDLYVKDTPRPEGDKPRLVYYGSTARLRDYGGRLVTGDKKDGQGNAMAAVNAQRHLLTRVFLGTNEGTEGVISQLFDEQTPYIRGIAAFSKALANSHGDIGIAPLGGDDFDKCKSELHWLEYALCDMAFIGQRFSGDGPYQVIRDGVDGILARGAQEWHDSVKRLAKSKDLREELAGRAKERVLAEYDYRQRAAEWAEVFRYAAEHPRIGEMATAA